MENWLSRTESLFGKEAIDKLKSSTVIVFGLGGVGGHCVEALARSGIGTIGLVDHDIFALTNLNRQILATHSVIGKLKVDIAANRIKEINPDVTAHAFPVFFNEETAAQIDLGGYDYIVDAIDTVTSKILLIQKAHSSQTKIISCMGTGNKLNPMSFKVADIFETSVCPLCRVMRSELKKRGITQLKTVYSPEEPITNARPPASNAFVPAAAGLLLASEVVYDLIK